MDPLSPKKAEYVLAAKVGIESVDYIDDLVREYMMFRGFNGTLQAFEDDLKRDQDKGFKPDSIVDELLTMATELKISPLLEYWQYLTFRFFSHLSPKYQRTTRMFEKRLIRLFLVSAVRKDQRPEIRKYFDEYGVILGQQGDWVPWLGLEYVQDPASRPEFEAYFSDDWYDSLRTALRDFMQTVFPAMAVPRIMLYEKERREKERLEARVKQLEEHFAGETKIKTTGVLGSRSGGLVENHIKSLATSVKSPKSAAATLANKGVAAKGKVADVGAEEVGVLASSNSLCVPNCDPGSYSPSVDLGIGVIQANEPASLLKISQEDIFLEHNSPVTLAKFSPSGEVIASYDEDMMLKVWSPDPESVAPKLKNRLGYPVSAMAWDNKYTHLLYLYDDEGYIHTLNTNTNLMSRQLAKEKRHPYIISMLSSPTSSSLLTLSSTSARNASDVSLRLWDANTSKTVASRRLSTPSDSQVVSASFNHNGNMLGIAYSTGQIQLLDARTLEKVASIDTKQRRTCAAEFSVNENSMVLVSEAGKLTQWSLGETNQMLAESHLDIGTYESEDVLPDDFHLTYDRVAFTPNREHVLVAPGKQCLVFNVDSAAMTDTMRRHKDLVTCIDFAADCSLSASMDGTIRVAQFREV